MVYMNDLADVTSDRSLLYADDLKIWTSDDQNALVEDIINVKNWSISWNLPINDAKCAHMSLGGTSANRFIIHDGTKASDIPTLELKKDLGVWIASNFSFKHHHSLAAKKGFGLLNMIKRTFPRISRDDFEQLYATYVRPLLEYASSVIHTGLQTDKLFLESVQQTATRLVRGIRTYPYSERLLLLDLFLLDIRRLHGDLMLTFRLFAESRAINFFPLAGIRLTVEPRLAYDFPLCERYSHETPFLRTWFVPHHWHASKLVWTLFVVWFDECYLSFTSTCLLYIYICIYIYIYIWISSGIFNFSMETSHFYFLVL